MEDQTVIRDPSPFSVGPQRIVNVICEDGSQRTAYCSPLGADTFFSIPSRVYAKGKTVAGYVGCDDGIWTFRAYRYRANWHAVTPELKPSLYMDFRPSWRRMLETSTAAANTVAGALH